VTVHRQAAPCDPEILTDLVRDVETRRGGVLSSGMEYPGRYDRWHLGYVDPCLELTAREFELLEHLMRNERIVVSRQSLLDEVWGYHPFAETNTVDVFISNLRRKLEQGGEPRVLHTIRGAGYVLREEP
jgi:DNA-binding response OmpR family regulator